MHFKRVVFPLPLLPIMANILPGFKLNDTSLIPLK